jgi:hypothetical protein
MHRFLLAARSRCTHGGDALPGADRMGASAHAALRGCCCEGAKPWECAAALPPDQLVCTGDARHCLAANDNVPLEFVGILGGRRAARTAENVSAGALAGRDCTCSMLPGPQPCHMPPLLAEWLLGWTVA